MRQRILPLVALLALSCTPTLMGSSGHEPAPGLKRAKFAVT